MAAKRRRTEGGTVGMGVGLSDVAGRALRLCVSAVDPDRRVNRRGAEDAEIGGIATKNA
jgi:hypothetical protein